MQRDKRKGVGQMKDRVRLGSTKRNERSLAFFSCLAVQTELRDGVKKAPIRHVHFIYTPH